MGTLLDPLNIADPIADHFSPRLNGAGAKAQVGKVDSTYAGDLRWEI